MKNLRHLKTLEKHLVELFVDTFCATGGIDLYTMQFLECSEKDYFKRKDQAIKAGYCLLTKKASAYNNFKFKSLHQAQLEYVTTILIKARGNRSLAAKILGIRSKEIRNVILLAQIRKANSPFLENGFEKKERSKDPTKNKKNTEDVSELFYPMPTNLQRLDYINNPTKKMLDKTLVDED